MSRKSHCYRQRIVTYCAEKTRTFDPVQQSRDMEDIGEFPTRYYKEKKSYMWSQVLVKASTATYLERPPTRTFDRALNDDAVSGWLGLFSTSAKLCTLEEAACLIALWAIHLSVLPHISKHIPTWTNILLVANTASLQACELRIETRYFKLNNLTDLLRCDH